jgi:hypothetical protein
LRVIFTYRPTTPCVFAGNAETGIHALLFGSNSETDEENGSYYEPSSNEDEEEAISDDDSEQISEG